MHRLTRRMLSGSLGLLPLARTGATRAAQSRRLIVGMSGWPPAFEPVLYMQTATRRVVPQLFDTLLRVDPKNDTTLRPALAESVQRISDQALQVRLRPGVKFHDGSILTAEDVAFSFGPAHLLGPGQAGRGVAMATLDRLDRVEVVDPLTVIVYAKGPDPALEQRLGAWASQIVSRQAFESAGSWDRWANAPVGTGPYKLVEQKTDVRVLLRAHEAYWGGPPPFHELEYRVVPEVASRINGLLAGDLDLITDVPPDQFSSISGRPDLHVVGGAIPNVRYLAIDTTDPVLRDVRIRRALSLAIDRVLITRSLWEGRVSVPNGFQLASFGPMFIEDFPAPRYDQDEARALLRAAGYRGDPITYKLLTNYYPTQVATAQALVEMWRAVGLNVHIQMLENFSQIYKRPVHAIWDSSTTANFPDPLGLTWHDFGPAGTVVQATGPWRNDEYLALGQRLQSTMDLAERRRAHRRWLEILGTEDPPGIVLHVSGQFYGKRKDVAWQPRASLDMGFGPFDAGSGL